MLLHENKQLFSEAINYASKEFGIEQYLIEKDYFICMMLKGLFEKNESLIFKGGTSLSKCFKLINRFSEDIDLTLSTSTTGKRRKLKESIQERAEELGITITNLDKTRSRRDFNRYEIDYHFTRSTTFIKPFLYIETVYSVSAYPTIKTTVQSFIAEAMKKRGLHEMIEQYSLESFEVTVQSLERTFIDKVFAVCDYHIDRRIEAHSRHLYDLYKLFPLMKFDDSFKELLAQTRESRKANPYCYSVAEGANVSQILRDVIEQKTYEADYENITLPLLYEKVPYKDTIENLEKIIALGLF